MEANPKIKVIGVGGSGSNAVSRMMKCEIRGVELIALDADAQNLQKTKAHKKLRIGKELTKGLGTGMNPEIGKKAAEEQKEEIENLVKGADMVFVACGLGGGCGTGAGPVICEIARNSGALTVAVVTKPFSFEGRQRMLAAEEGKREIKEKIDALVCVNNEKLLPMLDSKTSVSEAFWACDEVLRQAVQGISDLVLTSGIINVDFADVKTIMKDSGLALFGIGVSKGESRAKEAAKMAINYPLLDVSPKGAKGVLFNVRGGKDISLCEIDEAAKVITEEVSAQAKVIFGAIQDEKLKKGEIKVTVVATGVENK